MLLGHSSKKLPLCNRWKSWKNLQMTDPSRIFYLSGAVSTCRAVKCFQVYVWVQIEPVLVLSLSLKKKKKKSSSRPISSFSRSSLTNILWANERLIDSFRTRTDKRTNRLRGKRLGDGEGKREHHKNQKLSQSSPLPCHRIKRSPAPAT